MTEIQSNISRLICVDNYFRSFNYLGLLGNYVCNLRRGGVWVKRFYVISKYYFWFLKNCNLGGEGRSVIKLIFGLHDLRTTPKERNIWTITCDQFSWLDCCFVLQLILFSFLCVKNVYSWIIILSQFGIFLWECALNASLKM